MSTQSQKTKYTVFKLIGNLGIAPASSGFDNWSNIHTRSEEHEKSKQRLQKLQCALNCYELQQKLELTVDKENKIW